ncbi:zinc finger BED domain-containing protein RICESLEEPER 2-like [Cicer arietinum]|uniref:zinc finger BED domain-containing protein RICESLEEPER 2-like n=1 Tax=Cicer arietinum TaxID=3827 RepID=UPI003CC5E799
MSSIGDYVDSPLMENEEHIATTSVAPSGEDISAHLPSSKRKNRSQEWNHFTEVPNSGQIAKCHYCGHLIKFKDGTSAMIMHLKRCKEHPDNQEHKRQKTQNEELSVVSSPHSTFDQAACRLELVKMFVGAELPFRFVENVFFRNFVNVLQPQFDIPSRTTLRRAIWSLFDAERERLKIFISKHCGRVCLTTGTWTSIQNLSYMSLTAHFVDKNWNLHKRILNFCQITSHTGEFMDCGRVCLTTDTWTSIQNLSYMSLTAHFVDKNWNLHKRILNFCQITSHTGEFMAKEVETCLNAWELDRVFSITVDNASSNDVGIKFMKKWMNARNCLLLNGEYIHMRCCAHILSLIVKEGLKDEDISIIRIRKAVKYVRSSPSRLARFKGCVEREKISYKGLICLDVETRWNSTYLMLVTAVKYKKAFDLLEIADAKYVKELSKDKGPRVPLSKDWDFANTVLPFLRIFYDATVRISGSSYVTSNIYMKEVFAIGRKIRLLCEHNDASIKLMGISVKSKYDKYWGNIDGINVMLLIAVVLDPTSKFGYVNYFLDYFFEVDGEALKTKLSSSLKSIYREYEGREEGSQSMGESQPEEDDNDIHGMGFYKKSTGQRIDPMFELDKYLAEECEPYFVEFDILNWWKVNSTRFPILSSIAREVLAIPVSTVA